MPREHDTHLQHIVRAAQGGKSQLCVLVGESSTGKTRAAWEAVQILAADEWRLWHPFDPTRAEAALAGLAAVGPKTVVWLNEAQHYLAHPEVGEKIAAALRTLLAATHRAPILVLGTLWPVHWADSIGRCNTSSSEVLMGRPAGWMASLTGRSPMKSPGAPALRREGRSCVRGQAAV
ncbi:hypothetical protein ACFY20_34865 [Streptomyces sp. NPDC001312]|uniref:hypothetical protein n=1 Tax=Streptomyces sp. NPDC001312 TaxID=3364561 RepID=UPI003697BBB9